MGITYEQIKGIIGRNSSIVREIETSKSCSSFVSEIEEPRFHYISSNKWWFDLFDFPIIKAKINPYEIIIVTDFFQIKCKENGNIIDEKRQLFVILERPTPMSCQVSRVVLCSVIKGWDLDDVVASVGSMTKATR